MIASVNQLAAISTTTTKTRKTPKMIGTLLVSFVVLVGSVLALPAAASDNDLYIEYSGGVSYIRNQRLTGGDASGASLGGKIESDIGFNVAGAIGKRFHEFFRGEIQLGYRRSEANNISVQNETPNAQGYIGLLTVMANGYLDYDLGIGIIPYIGAGVGWGMVEIDAKNTNGLLRIDDQFHVFTWSLMAGGSVPINELVDITLGYRYIATTDVEYDSSVSGPVTGARLLDSEFDAHEGVLGIRYKF